MFRAVRTAVLSTLALALAGCASWSKPPELDVEAQWFDAMRRLNMFGFYPASEDVQPGDVLLYAPPATGLVAYLRRQIDQSLPWPRASSVQSSRFSLLRIASLDVPFGQRSFDNPHRPPIGSMRLRDHLVEQDEEQLRIQPLSRIPTSPGEKAAPPALVAGRRPAAQENTDFMIGNADQAAHGPRLQRSAVPALTVARLSQAQLGAAGLFGNIGANLGWSASQQVALSISIRDIQELSLDAWRVNAFYASRAPHMYHTRVWPNNLLMWLDQLRPDLTASACNGDREALRRAGVGIHVVNRVLYAGAIEYSFSDQAAQAVRVAVDLKNTLAAGVRQEAAIPALPTAAAGKPATATTPQAQVAETLNSVLASANGIAPASAGGTPTAGIQASLGVGSLGGISLMESFNRPIAVGAGSRMQIAFHEALRGIPPEKIEPEQRVTWYKYRFLVANEFCQINVEHYDPEKLWNVMRDSNDLFGRRNSNLVNHPTGRSSILLGQYAGIPVDPPFPLASSGAAPMNQTGSSRQPAGLPTNLAAPLLTR